MNIIYGNLQQNPLQRSVYLRSTDVETTNYHKLLWSIPDEWLWFLANNNKIVVIDKSSNKIGKIEKIFIPVLTDVLNNVLFKKEPDNKKYIYHYKKAIECLKKDKCLMAKFKCWKGVIKKINIEGKTIRVTKEENILYKMKQKV